MKRTLVLVLFALFTLQGCMMHDGYGRRSGGGYERGGDHDRHGGHHRDGDRERRH